MIDDFCNMNGLINGLIPTGVQCPFRNKCIFVVGGAKGVVCKRPERMENNFSCGAARAFSLVEKMKNE